MPDGDKIHSELPGPYQEAYQCLCEGQAPWTVARGFERGLKKSLRHHGDEPVKFLCRLPELFKGPLFEQEATKNELLDTLEEDAHKCINDRRARGIALKTAKHAVNTYWRSGIAPSEVVRDVCAAYVANVFEESCTSRIQNTATHHEAVPHDVIATRVADIVEQMDDVYRMFGSQLARRGKTAGLRLSSVRNEDTEDLLQMDITKV